MLRRPERQTEERLLATKAMVASFIDFELATGLEQWNSLLQIRPTAAYYTNRGVVLGMLGRHAEEYASD